MTFNPSQARMPAGAAGGGQWGAPRSSAAATAQKNTKAQTLAAQLKALPRTKRAAFIEGLSNADLKAVTGVIYSHATSNPDVVAMRIAVANEMSKRGFDVKKFGALGGGGTFKSKAAPKAKAPVKKAAAKAPTKAPVKAPPIVPASTNTAASGRTKAI